MSGSGDLFQSFPLFLGELYLSSDHHNTILTSCYQKCHHCIMKDKDYLWLNLRDLPYFRAMLRAVEAQFYQAFELPAPTLDLGCGDGHFASIAFERKLEGGLDPWSGPIHQAARAR